MNQELIDKFLLNGDKINVKEFDKFSLSDFLEIIELGKELGKFEASFLLMKI